MKKILIVDDDPAHAELIGDFCEAAGFEVQMVNDPRLAWQRAVSWRPDLITLDLEMPHMDGVDVLRQLQSRPHTSRIPVIIISVVAKSVNEEGFLRGSRMVFEKPLEFAKLLDFINKISMSPPPAAQGDPAFVPFKTVPTIK